MTCSLNKHRLTITPRTPVEPQFYVPCLIGASLWVTSGMPSLYCCVRLRQYTGNSSLWRLSIGRLSAVEIGERHRLGLAQ